MRLLVALHANSFNFWCDISPRLTMFVDFYLLLQTVQEIFIYYIDNHKKINHRMQLEDLKLSS